MWQSYPPCLSSFLVHSPRYGLAVATRNPLSVLLRGSSCFATLRGHCSGTHTGVRVCGCLSVRVCDCVTRIVTGTRDLSTIQVTYFIISLAHDYTGAHTSARLQVYRGSCTRVLQTHTYRQGIHTAVYVCVYTYNLTIHITMYTFFVFLRVWDWEGKGEERFFFSLFFFSEGSRYRGESNVGRFCLCCFASACLCNRSSRVCVCFGLFSYVSSM